jgi:Arc/MetJ-type ribon-helix-helix transcriptional regulator
MTPDMDRFLEELARTRTRKGQPVSKADLLRDAVRLYLDQQADLTGSRKQIAKSLEGKMEDMYARMEGLSQQLEMINQQVQKQADYLSRVGHAVQSLIDRLAVRSPSR